MNYFIDTHCHLDFFDSPQEIIDTAIQKGVKQLVIPSVNTSSFEKLLQLKRTYPSVFIAFGLYPTTMINDQEKLRDTLDAQEIKDLENNLKKYRDKVTAIGECGLDFTDVTDDHHKEVQLLLLRQHFELAQMYNLPLIIHNRKANDKIISLLHEYQGKVKGVLHCFAGSKQYLKAIFDTDFYVGLGGLLTLDTGLQVVTKNIPLSRIVLETDAPYLTPKQVRDHKPWPNEPANVPFVAEKLAEIKGISVSKVATITTENAQQLFSLPKE